MDGQDYLRKQVKERIENHCIKHLYFYNQIGVGATHWSLWYKGDRILSDERAEKLKEVLAKSNIKL